jgi:hypothetical protein
VSDPNILIGYIEELRPDWRPGESFVWEANDAALAALPEDDAWPPLVRAMFSVTGPDELHGSHRRRRLIHFAGHLNHFIRDLGEWLDKFERLLRTLYWTRAEVLVLNCWSGPPVRLMYSVTSETIKGYDENPPRLPQAWEMRGGQLNTEYAEGDDLAEFIGENRRLTRPEWL